MHIQSLHIYPIKSLQGISLNTAKLVNTGLQYDRQWMLIDEQQQFLSQRKIPAMATLKTAIHANKLHVSNAQGDSITLDLETHKTADIEVTIWHDQVMAATESDDINHWFSQQLNTPCRLVRLANRHQRLVDTHYAHQQEQVGFADGFPLLVVAASNIELLNSKLKAPVSMERFRPNIVIAGLEAHEEDSIQTIHVDNIAIDLVKPCSRCVIPSIDQTTGEKRDDILPALLAYRKKGNKIYFGMNGLHQHNGILKVNSPIKIIKK